MLERISEVQGIGLLHQANGKPHTCQKATLIYADNGRGKSTLATIFRSASTGMASLISACKTVDGTNPPKVNLQFGSGHKVIFDNGSWSEVRPELVVFDADFVARNVHSGGTVNTEHRKNLLEFALGEAAVSARGTVETAMATAKFAADHVQKLQGQLSGHHTGITSQQFENLPPVSDADTQIEKLQKRLSAANNIATIQAKAVPKPVAEPTFDVDSLFRLLSLSLKDVHTDAEHVVRQHVSKLNSTAAEDWLSHGRQLGDGEACPYCDQDITDNDLVRAYQTHFNAAYADLKTEVSGLQRKIETGADRTIIEGIEKSIGVASAQALAWADHAATESITIDATSSYTALEAFRAFVSALNDQKQLTPVDAVGSEAEKKEALDLWEQVLIPIRTANAAIEAAGKVIVAYKTQLSGDSITQLQQQMQDIQVAKRRHEPAVVKIVTQLVAARAIAKKEEKTKKAAREMLDKLMTATLDKYQISINALLQKFGTSFAIRGMSANFRGNSPRSEYGLLLRGKDVALEGGPPSFATALSEGDKRTLAFAFFVASTLEDPNLNTRTIIIDDPMCSLDLNRRHYTRTVLKKIYSRAAQLIILAHDPYFVRDLRDGLRKDDKDAQIALFQLASASHGYSDFDIFDVDMECESAYAQHHRMLSEFSAGVTGDAKSAAKAIRPMLEGYLHRRYPGLLPKDQMFGQIVVEIRDSVAPHPLSHARNLVEELTEINDYAGQFHHDTNPDADTVTITATELKTFADRALDLIYKGTPP